MSQTLIKAGPGNEMLSGVQPSLDPQSATLWVDGENVISRKLGVEKAPGFTTQVTLTEDVFDIAQAYVEGVATAWLGSDRRLYKYTEAGGAVNLYQFPTSGDIRIETWGNWIIATNGIAPVKLYKNNAIQEIADIPFDWCKLLYRNNVHMLAAHTSNGVDWIEWSAASDIETWTPDASNSARNITLRDLGGPIKFIGGLGRRIAVYSAEKMVVGQWTGHPFIFRFDPAITGIGAVGGRAVVEVGNNNFGLHQDGLFGTDGNSYALLDEPTVQAWLKDNVDFTQGEKIVGYHNDALEQVVFHFPAVGGGYLGIPYNYKNKVFGARLTGSVTAVNRRFVFDEPIAVIGQKFVFLAGTNAGSEALSSYIRTKPLDAGDSTVRKVFDYLQVTGQWTGGKVRLGALENPNDLDSIEWFYDEAMAREHFFERDTPFLVVEFSASLVDETFRVSQFLVAGESTGAVI